MSDFVKSASNMSKNYDRMVAKNNSVRIGVLGILILYCVLVVPMLTVENLNFLEILNSLFIIKLSKYY